MSIVEINLPNLDIHNVRSFRVPVRTGWDTVLVEVEFDAIIILGVLISNLEAHY